MTDLIAENSKENIDSFIAKHWTAIKGVAEIFDEGETVFSSQQTVLSLYSFPELMYWGTRAHGKTVLMAVDFAMGVGRGYASYNCLFVREEAKALERMKNICDQLFKEFFGEDNFRFKMSKADYYYEFWDGSKLYLGHGSTKEDYDAKFHGQEYSRIYVDEAGVRKDMKFIKLIKTCLRTSKTSSNPNTAPLALRLTANPEGDCYSELEEYFMPDGVPGKPTPDGKKIAIFGMMDENEFLEESYKDSFEDMDQAEKDAYRYGLKSERLGTFFAECFDTHTHFIKPFKIPSNWNVDRTLDWGTGSPFSVLWFAESKGEMFIDGDGKNKYVPKGSIFVIQEYYGCKNAQELNTGIYLDAYDLSQNILHLDRVLRNNYLTLNHKINDGPADNSIWNDRLMSRTKCIAKLLEDGGTKWKQSNKNKGSRVAGAEYIRTMLNAARKDKPDQPHLYIFNTCKYLKTNLLNLKEDPKNKGDVLSEGVPDHDYDALRYRILQKDSISKIFNKR